jgi:putative membrane protein insertion efficiency factor
MTRRNFYIAPIKGYQYISKMLPASCRYYPTCSEYATWQFACNVPHKALISSTLRILRCNQLFKGGIDYPFIAFTPPKYCFVHRFNGFCGKIKVIYWLVPHRSTPRYYIIKDFDAITRSS